MDLSVMPLNLLLQSREGTGQICGGRCVDCKKDSSHLTVMEGSHWEWLLMNRNSYDEIGCGINMPWRHLLQPSKIMPNVGIGILFNSNLFDCLESGASQHQPSLPYMMIHLHYVVQQTHQWNYPCTHPHHQKPEYKLHNSPTTIQPIIKSDTSYFDYTSNIASDHHHVDQNTPHRQLVNGGRWPPNAQKPRRT